jgi:hypothetical protein
MIPFQGSGLYVGESPEKTVSDTTHVIMCDFKDYDKFTCFDNLYDYIYLDDIIQKLDSLEDIFKKSFKAIRPGGYVFAKVPDFKLYEKYIWPSIYMIDHKISFSNEVSRPETNRPNHWHTEDLTKLSEELGYQRFCFEVDDENFDYDKPLLENQAKHGASCHLILKFKK